jgi:hypothetical protein
MSVNTLNVAIALGLAFAVASCSSTETTHEADNAVHAHRDDTALQLNHGKKWKVDDHMMDELRELEIIVTHSAAVDPRNLDNIADSLIVHLDILTSNCTMQGQAHDELHKWLVPFIDLVNEFANYEDETEALSQLDEMKEKFKLFNSYFE